MGHGLPCSSALDSRGNTQQTGLLAAQEMGYSRSFPSLGAGACLWYGLLPPGAALPPEAQPVICRAFCLAQAQWCSIETWPGE